jgi:putative FmdB family regulatory protein
VPIYEYRCLNCRKKVSIFFRSMSGVAEPKCPECGGANLERLFSRVVVRRGGSRAESNDGMESAGDEPGGFGGEFGIGPDPYGDPYGSESGVDPFGFDEDADPREIARMTRQMSAQMGEPLDADLDRALSDLERGADPDEVMGRLEESEPPPSPEE